MKRTMLVLALTLLLSSTTAVRAADGSSPSGVSQTPVYSQPQGTNPTGNVYGQSTQATLYIDDDPNVSMASGIFPYFEDAPSANLSYIVLGLLNFGY